VWDTAQQQAFRMSQFRRKGGENHCPKPPENREPKEAF